MSQNFQPVCSTY